MKKDTNGKKVVKTVFLVIAIVVSVVFVPVLALLPSVGGSVAAVMEMVTLERLEEITEESGLAKSVYDIALEEITGELSVAQLTPETTEKIIKNSLKKDDFEQWLTLLLEGIYTGDVVKIDLDRLQVRVEQQLEELMRDGFEEVYAVWKDGADTVNFSREYVETLFSEWEEEFLNQYETYGAENLEELEQLYDQQYGEGAFTRLCEEKIEELRAEWDSEITENIRTMVADGFAQAEAKVSEVLQEVIKNPDVRETFDGLREIGRWSGRARIVVYGVLAVLVLLLLALYWFEIPGFVVTAVPLFTGGVLCKLVASQTDRIATRICEELFKVFGENEEVVSISSSLLENALRQVRDSISVFGTVALVMALVLAGGAVLCGVLKRKKKTVEGSESGEQE